MLGLALVGSAAAQDLGLGTVQGAAALNVRKGPGASNPSIGMLRRGDPVRVKELVGKWALVTSGDLTGYVHSAFIQMEIEAEATPGREAAAAPTPTSIPGEPAATEPRAPGQPPSPTRRAALLDAALREDIQRILALSEELQQDLESLRSQPTPPAPRPESGISVQSGLGLLGLGAVIGFFIGIILGRQQERGGRSRVRI